MRAHRRAGARRRGPAIVALLLAVAGAADAQQQPARPATPQARRQADSAALDSALRVEYRREVYSYRGGSRDPFSSLVQTTDVGPGVNELRLVSIAYDPRGGNSFAVVRHTTTNELHRLRRGNQIGRLRVIQIRQTEVVFQVEEFGFERQEVLTLSRPEGSR